MVPLEWNDSFVWLFAATAVFPLLSAVDCNSVSEITLAGILSLCGIHQSSGTKAYTTSLDFMQTRHYTVNRSTEDDERMEHDGNERSSERLFGKKTGLSSLIDYQEGSVVSRTLINKEAGTVTMFAFDKEQGLSEHTAPYDALVHILDGEADITISGKTHYLKEGEIIIMPANQPHALKAAKRFKMMLTMIRSEN